MFDHKKIAAFLASLLMCFSAMAAPAAAYSENDDETISAETETSDETAADDALVTSGIFSYYVTDDGCAQIQGCSSTDTELVIPDTIDGITVTELSRTAFGSDPDNCPFEKISLPASIEYISADNPFMFCSSLKEITVDEASEYFCADSGVLYTKDMTKLICYPQAMGGTSFTIPEGVTEIGSAALYNTGLSDITFPSTLEKTNYFSLGGLEDLTKADLSGTALTEMGIFTFSGCSSLSEVLLPDTLYSIEGGAFYNCKSLKEITLPESLEYVGQYAFMDTGLTSIEIPESVTEIGYCAFGYYTDEYGSERASSSFTIIGQYSSAAYTYCTDTDEEYGYANEFTFMTPEQAQEQSELLAQERFTEGSYEYAIVGDGAVITLCTSADSIIDVPAELGGYPVTAIYPIAFSSLNAAEITLPDTITDIRTMAFYNCAYLQSLSLPQSVKSIGNNAFDSCTGLETIDLGGAETIGLSVFYGCTSLRKVTISGSCTEITLNGDGDLPFIDTPALEEIIVTDGNGSYSSENGVLYNKDKTILLAYPPAKADKKFKAPSGVKEIAQSAFYNCKHLEEVDISGVTTINTYAFEGCTSLKKVKLSKELTSIGVDAFFDCTSLKQLRFYDKVDTIGDYAFGFYYNKDADTENGEETEVLVDGFRVYCSKDSDVYKYAQTMGIETVTGTIDLFGKNVDITFLWIMGGILVAAAAALIGVLTGKHIKKKKAEKEDEERKKAIEEKRTKKQEASDGKSHKMNEGSPENGEEEYNE